MSCTSSTPIVMDIGSDSCKAGFAGENDPKCVIPSVVGRSEQQGHKVGQEAINLVTSLTLKYPVERGVVTDWDSMEIIWDHIFKEKLSVKPTEHPVLLTETPQNPQDNREKMAEVIFEKFQVPAVFFSCQAVLCLYSAGRSTGLVLDIGSGVTTVVPVYEGYSLPEAIVRINLAGQDITEYLAKLLSGSGCQLSSASDKIHVRNIKEKHCFVSQKDGQQTTTPAATYQLPDGKVISLGNERFQCTELLFQPSVAGFEEKPGIHEMVNKAISACELDTRKSLYTNVILSGGSTLFEGMADRLKHELKSFGALGAEARVSAPKDRTLSAWSGGSVLASLPTFPANWITKKDYEDGGPQIVHSRCF